MSADELTGRPVIFGEVLFDHFPDMQVLGGAPFNVACHLQGFGLNPLFVSRIGKDRQGEEILAAMQARKMDLSGIQQDKNYPTGQVKIELKENGGHSFEILSHQAYDYIDGDKALEAVTGTVPMLYCGSLATREAESAQALDRLRAKTGAPLFIDINLRAPWWSKDKCISMIREARWLKLNDEELDELSSGSSGMLERAETFRKEMDIETMILTMGESGAAFLYEGGSSQDKVPELETGIVDTVGAGDSFAAVAITGLIKGWRYPEILARALEFAAEICRHRGATLSDRDIYDRFLTKWNV